MPKIGIISDTHGLLRPEVTEVLKSCETILHGGDINNCRILEELNQIAPTYAVRGNNDKEWAKDLPETLLAELSGIRFYMVHNKKNIPKDLKDVDIIVYGHSHKYEEKVEGGILRLNPGSCGPRRFTQPITFSVIEVGEDGSYQVQKIEIPHAPKDKAFNEDKKCMEEEIRDRDMKRIIKSVMQDTDKGISVPEIAVRSNIDEELAEQICRLYLTHPGVNADGIMSKMGL